MKQVQEGSYVSHERNGHGTVERISETCAGARVAKVKRPDGSVYRVDAEQLSPVTCAMQDCSNEAQHECPKCHKLFCDECRELFLPIDPMFWAETAMICAQCHYEMYGA